MKIFVPFTRIAEATRIALLEVDWTPVDVSSSDHAYSEFLQERWSTGEPFVNVEHDSVPWPGAIAALINCPRYWCFFDCYGGNPPLDIRHTPPIALVKFGRRLIAETPNAWDRPVHWGRCDLNLATRARLAGVPAHQHWPSIVNANPNRLR